MLLHHFVIVSKAAKDYSVRREWRHFDDLDTLHRQSVTLHDDLIQYLSDSLDRIPCFNPSTQTYQQGLSRYGISVITTVEAVTAGEVFNAWARLFAAGPQNLHLTGSYAYCDGNPDSGKRQDLAFDRDEIVATLTALSSMCERVSRGNHAEYLLHLGI